MYSNDLNVEGRSGLERTISDRNLMSPAPMKREIANPAKRTHIAYLIWWT